MDDAPINGLTVLRSQTVANDKHEITFRIIGESHWVTISRNRQVVLQEILACVNLEEVLWHHTHPFTDKTQHFFETTAYSVSIIFQPFVSQMKNFDTRIAHLQLDFPNPVEGTTLPFTRIWWSFSGTSLCWETIHVYPSPQGRTTAVLSASKFVLTS
jgi:hypothetical protein